MILKNIVLIGMPGSGKSTIGVILAKSAGMPFLDTDLLIQNNEGMVLQDIIIKKGLSDFLKIEEEAIVGVTETGHVIATGGSAVYSHKAMQHLRMNGIIIYLKLPYHVIEKRIKNITTRGIAMGKEQSLLDIYNERVLLYENYADITINCEEKDMEVIIEEILKSLKIKNILINV